MNNILAWNVRGLNTTRKQSEVSRYLLHHHVSLFGLLETKVKHHNLGPAYQRLCPGWCFTHNLAWSDKGRIMIGWKEEEMVVHISFCSSQIMHLEVKPVLGSPFVCSFVYGATNKAERGLSWVISIILRTLMSMLAIQ